MVQDRNDDPLFFSNSSHSSSYHPPDRLFNAGHTVSLVTSVLSLSATAFVLASFITFPWLRSWPRNLYMHYSAAVMLDSVLSLARAYFVMSSTPYDDQCCMHAINDRLMAHLARPSAVLWMCCISIAVLSELVIVETRLKKQRRSKRGSQSPLLKAPLRNDADVKARRRRNMMLSFCVGSWGVPAAVTVGLAVYYDLCSFSPSFFSTGEHQERMIGYVLNIVGYLTNIVLFVLCLRKARHCLISLGVGDPKQNQSPTIRETSLSHNSVYRGMFLVFGTFRLPQVLYDAWLLRLESNPDHTYRLGPIFWFIWIASFSFYPLVGAVTAWWFTRRFKLGVLWRNKLFSAQDDPVIETVIGLF